MFLVLCLSAECFSLFVHDGKHQVSFYLQNAKTVPIVSDQSYISLLLSLQ